MIRFFLILAFVLGSARAANATICTIPTTLVNGSIVDAAQLNGNFTSLQSCGNAIDNTNIGANGIFATQMKPTSLAQASFGGTFAYTFPAGLNVNGALLKANAGLTVVGTTNLAATTFSVAPTMSGANIAAGTIPNSALASGGFLDTSATAQTKAGTLTDTAGFATGSTTIGPTNATFAGVGSFNGPVTVQSVLNSGAAGHIPPMYSSGGADVATTVHIVADTATAGSNSVAVTLLGNAAFTAANTYVCTIHDRTTQSVLNNYASTTGTAFNWSATAGDTYDYVCIGR